MRITENDITAVLFTLGAAALALMAWCIADLVTEQEAPEPVVIKHVSEMEVFTASTSGTYGIEYSSSGEVEIRLLHTD